MDKQVEQFRNMLRVATSRIGVEYFQLPVAGTDDSVYRERVYCYELYHQLRSLWGEFPFTLGGEVDKNGAPYFRGGAYAKAKPDLLVHAPGRIEGNLVVIEVKPITASVHDITDDLRKLTWFHHHARYERGVFLCYGASDGEGGLRENLHYASQRKDVDLSVLDFFYHPRCGENAVQLLLQTFAKDRKPAAS